MSLKLNDEQRKLVEQNHNLIYSAMRKFGVRNEKFDDYYDVAAIGLCKAAIYYDESKNTTLSTLVYSCVQNELYKQFRSEKSASNQFNKHVLSYNILCNTDTNFKSTMEDVLLVDKNFEKNLITMLLFKDRMDTLKNKDKQMIDLRMSGYTYDEIAKRFGVTRQAVQQKMNRLKAKLLPDIN